ncbi:MAG TPA: hypothetical protein VFW66_02470 [Gemmatimonadales bacterium]|nr:hypothetical protein [Gemmatimonadales bacterium]
MSRRCEAGSRIVGVLGIIKNPGQQVNYGSGKPVSDETIADVGAPLGIRWFADSFVDLRHGDAGMESAPQKPALQKLAPVRDRP